MSNPKFTNQRLPKLLHRHLLNTLVSLNDPFWKQININRLTMRSDLHVAHVFYTFFGTWKANEVDNLLQKKMPLLKRQLSRKWPLKRLPQLVFINDQKIVKQEQVWEILHTDFEIKS